MELGEWKCQRITGLRWSWFARGSDWWSWFCSTTRLISAIMSTSSFLACCLHFYSLPSSTNSPSHSEACCYRQVSIGLGGFPRCVNVFFGMMFSPLRGRRRVRYLFSNSHGVEWSTPNRSVSPLHLIVLFFLWARIKIRSSRSQRVPVMASFWDPVPRLWAQRSATELSRY